MPVTSQREISALIIDFERETIPKDTAPGVLKVKEGQSKLLMQYPDTGNNTKATHKIIIRKKGKFSYQTADKHDLDVDAFSAKTDIIIDGLKEAGIPVFKRFTAYLNQYVGSTTEPAVIIAAIEDFLEKTNKLNQVDIHIISNNHEINNPSSNKKIVKTVLSRYRRPEGNTTEKRVAGYTKDELEAVNNNKSGCLTGTKATVAIDKTSWWQQLTTTSRILIVLSLIIGIPLVLTTAVAATLMLGFPAIPLSIAIGAYAAYIGGIIPMLGITGGLAALLTIPAGLRLFIANMKGQAIQFTTQEKSPIEVLVNPGEQKTLSNDGAIHSNLMFHHRSRSPSLPSILPPKCNLSMGAKDDSAHYQQLEAPSLDSTLDSTYETPLQSPTSKNMNNDSSSLTPPKPTPRKQKKGSTILKNFIKQKLSPSLSSSKIPDSGFERQESFTKGSEASSSTLIPLNPELDKSPSVCRL